MTTSKLSNLTKVTDPLSPNALLYLADTADEITYAPRAIRITDLVDEHELTGGDGVDITDNAVSVDIVPGSAATETVSGASGLGNIYNGSYEYLGAFKLVGAGPRTFTADSSFRAFYKTFSQYQHVLIWDETASEWSGFQVNTSDPDDVTGWTGGETVSLATGLESGARQDTGDGWRPMDGTYNGVTFQHSAGGTGKLQFTSGQLDINESALSITESQISDFGDYVTSTDNTAALALKADTADVYLLDGSQPLTAALDAGNFRLTNVAEPLLAQHAATKAYADGIYTSATTLASSTFLHVDGTNAATGNLAMGGNEITNIASPSVGSSAANKAYVDAAIVTGVGGVSLGSVTDVELAGVASGHFLRFDGSDWVNTALVAADIPNLDAAKITTGTLDANRIPNVTALNTSFVDDSVDPETDSYYFLVVKSDGSVARMNAAFLVSE